MSRKINQIWSRTGKRLALGCSAALLVAAPAQAQNVRVTSLTNFTFGTIANLLADQTQSKSLCAYSSTGRYSVRATGSGAGGAFALSAGTRTLAYEVQWNSAAAQTSGTALTAGVTRSGFTTAATNQTCLSGPSTTASLIVILRAASLSAASAGSYTGTLTILLAPQ